MKALGVVLLGLLSFAAVSIAAAGVASSPYQQAQNIVVNPVAGLPGTPITIVGAGFAPPLLAGVEVTVTMDGRVVARPPTDNFGGFTTIVLVPQLGPGRVEIVASDGQNRATTSFTVLAPSIEVDPPGGTPGARVTITGTDFPANAPVTGLSMSSVSVLPAVAPFVDDSGKFEARVIVPELPTGISRVEATVGDMTISTLFNVDVSPAPTEKPTPATPVDPVTPVDPGGPWWREPLVIAAGIAAFGTITAAGLRYLGIRPTGRRPRRG